MPRFSKQKWGGIRRPHPMSGKSGRENPTLPVSNIKRGVGVGGPVGAGQSCRSVSTVTELSRSTQKKQNQFFFSCNLHCCFETSFSMKITIVTTDVLSGIPLLNSPWKLFCYPPFPLVLTIMLLGPARLFASFLWKKKRMFWQFQDKRRRAIWLSGTPWWFVLLLESSFNACLKTYWSCSWMDARW